ncbi:MAG TPA: hypothetical protein GX506_10650 [Firmicutes bacterium]|nr:hypothetical protein [Bacillota bacterium]
MRYPTPDVNTAITLEDIYHEHRIEVRVRQLPAIFIAEERENPVPGDKTPRLQWDGRNSRQRVWYRYLRGLTGQGVDAIWKPSLKKEPSGCIILNEPGCSPKNKRWFDSV